MVLKLESCTLLHQATFPLCLPPTESPSSTLPSDPDTPPWVHPHQDRRERGRCTVKCRLLCLRKGSGRCVFTSRPEERPRPQDSGPGTPPSTSGTVHVRSYAPSVTSHPVRTRWERRAWGVEKRSRTGPEIEPRQKPVHSPSLHVPCPSSVSAS